MSLSGINKPGSPGGKVGQIPKIKIIFGLVCLKVSLDMFLRKSKGKNKRQGSNMWSSEGAAGCQS